MIFKDTHISGFGKYTHEDFSFSEGINVVYGDNESGKSTLHSYLKSMLFGMERGRGKAAKNDAYTRYYPWNTEAPYGGSLTLENDEETFRIERTFDTRNKSLALRSENSGALLGDTEEAIASRIGNITEETFRNTISIEQLKATEDGSLRDELKNHLSSIALSGTSTLDMTHALSSLKEQKKLRNKEINGQASTEYEKLLAEIEETEEKLLRLGNQSEELDLQIASLEESLNAETELRNKTTARLSEAEAEAEEDTLSQIDSLGTYQERFLDACAAYHLAEAENELHKTHKVRVRDTLLGFGGFVLFVLLGIGVYFYEDLVQMPFPYPKYPIMIGFFVVAVLALILTLFMIARSRKDNSDSEAMVEETKNLLETEFAAHLGSSEVTQENEAELKHRIESYQTLTGEIQALHATFDASLNKTVALQEELQTARIEREKTQRQAWEYEQVSRRLMELEEKKEELLRTLEENKRLENQMAAIDLASSTISELSSRLHEEFSPTLNARVSEIMFAITAGRYDHLYIDENLHITIREGGRTVPIEALSRGTIEQIYLALRISAVELLYPDLSLPILLDDTFAYYDDSRLHNTLKWLAENYPGQVILFTCHKREAAFLSRMEAPYHLIALS